MALKDPAQMALLKPRKSKYRNSKIVVDGIKFDSKKEALRWQELRAKVESGLIRDLRRQVWFPLMVNNLKICSYVADFVYRPIDPIVWDHDIVEDVKSEYTRKLPVYRLKKKLMQAIHDIIITEI